MAALTATATVTETPTFPAAGRATFASLPLELVDLIIQHATSTVALSIRRERHLQNYALVHPAFVVACQRRLLRRPRVANIAQAKQLVQLVQGSKRMAGYVRELHVVGEHMNETGVMDALRGIGEACQMLSVVHLRNVGFNAALHASLLPRLTHLTLTSVNLSLSPTASIFPYLTQLTLSNVALLHTSSTPSFPCLQSLSYSNTLNSPYSFSADPLFFSSPTLTSLGPHLHTLQVSRLFSPTHYLSSRKSPALAAGPLPPRTPAADIEPTLEDFSALTNLTLLADSSHQAGAFFPLLDSLPSHPAKQLKQFEVLAELGCRDKFQEVEEMSLELVKRFFGGERETGGVEDEETWRWEGVEGKGKGKAIAEVGQEEEAEGKKSRGLQRLILPGVFYQLGGLPAVQELRKSAEARGVEIQFVL